MTKTEMYRLFIGGVVTGFAIAILAIKLLDYLYQIPCQ